MTTRLTNGVSTKRALAFLAAAGLAGAALTACSPPNEQPADKDAKGTTPAVVTGNQAIPGELVNADDVPAEATAAVGTFTLIQKEGKVVGAGSFVDTQGGTKLTMRVDGLSKGQHKVEVRNAKECFAGGAAAVISGGNLPGLVVDDHGSGSANQTVSVKIADLNEKILVVTESATGSEPIACGVIAAN
ncbi:MAG: hypothetical protein QM809_06020 [Gordonia sp. (in: high G+C Gram-positive bacteria)]|uniref:hypothetical protein n=1 Tax=Gordonia sp. (in: high G+C Gram-positive bacteria) TaxID=84139 RepID=UPI0039E560F8